MYSQQIDTGIQHPLSDHEMAGVLQEFDHTKAENAALKHRLQQLELENQRLKAGISYEKVNTSQTHTENKTQRTQTNFAESK